jgi:hypothetical protein
MSKLKKQEKARMGFREKGAVTAGIRPQAAIF